MARRKTRTGTGLSNPKSKVNISLTPEANDTLIALAKETGLTKSKVFENILVGTIAINSQTAEKQVTLGQDSIYLDDIDDEEKQDQADKSNSSSKDEANEAIQKELENQQQKIVELEEQINKQRNLVADKLKINQALEEELEVKNTQLKSIQLELKENNKKDDNKKDYQDSQKQLTELKNKLKTIEKDLQNKETEINTLNKQIVTLNSHIDSQKDLRKQIETQKIELEKYQHQVSVKEQENIALSQHYTQQRNLVTNNLIKENEQHKSTIATLNRRIADLESVANIGERMLNKWRDKINYNN